MAFSYLEKKAFKQGFKVIAGADEAGRGSLAGPVAAAVASIRFCQNFPLMRKIKDSKQLSPKQRDEIFEEIRKEPRIEWKVSFVWPSIIDKINILNATKLAWKRSLNKLNSKPDFLFLDGNQKINNLEIEQKPVVKGDQKIFLISLASIIAKVSRDKLMNKLSFKYPEYELINHKGYGTKLHLEKIKKFGPCQIHRKSFHPVLVNLSFRDKVYYIVSKIPKGKVMTYKEVAEKTGSPRSFRAVGSALNKNNNSLIPCHRVICSNGKIGGYNKGVDEKRIILRKEGIFI